MEETGRQPRGLPGFGLDSCIDDGATQEEYEVKTGHDEST